MTTLTRTEFEVLANMHSGRCISIFLPTHRSGREVLNGEDQLLFKNLVKKTELELLDLGGAEKEVREFLEPLKQMTQDGAFWRDQTEGLAVFYTRDFLRYYPLPFGPAPVQHLGYEFYIKPLLPLLLENPRFYLISLNFHEVKFYTGDRWGLEEVQLEGVLPQQVEEVVGFDYRQKFLGYHAQRGGHPQAIFHGHADWQEDRKDEILAFFRAINKEVSTHLAGQNVPLFLACLDYLYPIYEQANTYKHLSTEYLPGNPEYTKPAELHERVLDLLSAEQQEVRRKKEADFYQFHDTNRTATDIHDIVPAALGGQVDTLFLANDLEVWGIYDKRDASVRTQEEHNPSNVSLPNMVAVAVYLNGGRVYLADREAIPFPETGINALYRY
ncbi:MAG: hypothetical protein EP344_04395 [Bacteroidetes bacterium]|nr:MAG: hypothetical protein EP344_04395 [Bacteroidota bacterium]